MLVERVAIAVLILTVLSTSHQQDLPLVRHDKVAQHSTAGNKTRVRKFFHHENTASLDDRIHQQLRRNNEEERLKAESAGEGTGDVKASKSSTEEDDDDKKTLAQQVAEGKYGLIHTELFQTPPQRPGILTYKINPEVPKDNVNNLGGLEAEEIWLAENHLLVLAGGGYSKQRGQNWPPIDDYSAPRRQVKIPPNPKVPPPFPIQLTENGPIEIIRGVNGSYPRPLPFFPPSAGDINGTGVFPFFPPPPPGFSPGNFTPPPGFPFPFPPLLPNGSIPELPPPPPGLPPFPPANWTDLIDEDDPSIYYPPPYDFYFPKDNSSYVPAGPLVPGIVLPPPPDFFSPYDNGTKPIKTKLIKGPIIKKVKYQPPKQYFETATKLPDIVDNSLTTMTTPNYIYKTSTEPTRPTKPSVQVIQDYPATDDITNEVTPSNEKHNKDDDWVPIPAPRPYYITGPAKQIQENMLVIMSTPKQEEDTQGYDYIVPGKPLKYPERTANYPKENSIPDFYNGNNDNHVYADEVLVKQYLPITRKPKAKSKSTVAPAQTFHVPVRTGGKSLQATYYFYEDPHSEENIGLVPPRPVRPLRPSPPPMPPPNPTQASVEFYVPKEPIHIKPRPISVMNIYNPLPVMPINPYELRNPTTSTTTHRPSQLDYFSFNGEKNGGYNFMFPDGNPLLSPKSTSRPIFEYSYTAPGYKDETKKANAMDYYFNSYPSTKTTSKPTDFLYSYDNSLSTTPASHLTSQPKQNEIFSTTFKPIPTPSPPQVLVQYETPTTTPRTQDRYNYARTSTQKPWRDISGRKPINSLSFTTPHPFYAFFTHHDESLVDDITKKYFTLFGQKIRRPGGGYETTTPISEIQSPKKQNTRYEYYDENDYSKEKENSGHVSQNSQENYSNFDEVRPIQNNHNFDNSYPNSQESYYEQDSYNTKGNGYHTGGASTEDPFYSKYNLNTNSFRTSTVRPKLKLNYQSSKRPSQLISVSNSFNVEGDSKHKNPSLEYDYDYDYDKHPEPSLRDDTRVNNYRKPYVKDYEAEWIPSLSQQYQQDTRGDNAANQFISYKLPGNGNGHFFFLTPQAVQLEELANAFLFPSNVETRNSFYNKRNTNRTRRRPEETSTQSLKEKQSNKKS